MPTVPPWRTTPAPTARGLAFELPIRLEFVDALPRTQSGKVVKYQLRDVLSDKPDRQ